MPFKNKEDKNAYQREYYKRNKHKYIPKQIKRNLAHREKMKQRMTEFLNDKSCIVCGEDDIRCLEFDHRDPSSKTEMVSKMVTRGDSWKMIMEEVDKCDILCANCHRKKSASDGNYYRVRLSS